jgi:GR25 family glycosyltransferase involved in LPS biosynthesis
MKIFVINRDDRPERMERAREQLDVVWMPFERFEAIKTKPGWMGCRDSQLAILDKIKHMRWHDDYRFSLILEDDVLFMPDWWNVLRDARFFLPLDWSLLYLGCSPQSPLERHNKYLYKVKDSLCTHAILYNNRNNGVVDYILANKGEIQKIDVYYKDVIQEQFRCFVTYPICATQWQSKSDTCMRSDTSTILKNFNKHTNNAI